MNYVKVVNKAEILLYSTLISVMSGINQLKSPAQDNTDIQSQAPNNTGALSVKAYELTPTKAVAYHWENIQQTLLTLLLWTMLGLSAGFLIGMLNHG